MYDAAFEIQKALLDVNEAESQQLQDAAVMGLQRGGRIALNLVLAYIPVANKLAMIISIMDFIGNLSDVANKCYGTYALAAMASALSDNLKDNYASYLGYAAVDSPKYNGYLFRQLCVLRYCSEDQMKAADKANAFWIEWYFANFKFLISKIDENISRISQMKF